ncbi:MULTISPECIES: hypothetical protein [Staphylococcus]|uniref:Uncharacterized protein n=2 Tax=Staphylococcus TaxID=1279 RepID=A0A1Z3U010_9STAP|nr:MULTISPECIES: hypothetical protein [Staphylococcus]ASE36612.1 hypothetical protein CEP67_04735 [Staphylococcus pettenkoferi]EHM71095.1 hypothetical protein SEVCU012_1268 [Staphylococcus pettenkoferi VCU012]MBX8994346.1 hypothetical protein [Staphylococcus pettenkoferi]MCI2792244.1 hypothetical protein [Staphylococcus pettenkoferi]MCI2803836.1 hypothetical protein [Staphylococcus pettenkoferi]
MQKFIYIALICGVITGAGIFLQLPIFPVLFVPIVLNILGIICVAVTLRDKEVNGLLKLGGLLINIMPLFGAFSMMHQ